jgi:hypothetical protein
MVDAGPGSPRPLLFEKGKSAMENTQTVPALSWKTARFASAELATEAAELAKANGELKAFRISQDQGEYIISDISPKARTPKAPAKPKTPAKGKGKANAEPAKGKGKKGSAERIAEGLKPAAPKEPTLPANFLDGKPHKVSERRWIGQWVELKDNALKGVFPKVEKVIDAENQKEWNGGFFAAETHTSHRKTISRLLNAFREKNLKALRELGVIEKSSTRVAIGKLRDLAIAAIEAKNAKPPKAPKKKANGETPETPAAPETPAS